MKSTVQFKLTKYQLNSLESLSRKLSQAKETGKLGMIVAQIILHEEDEGVHAIFIEPEEVPTMFKIFGLSSDESEILELVEMYYGAKGLIMHDNSLKEGLSSQEAFNQLIELL